ncbi:rhodanese-like domain-containing protein [Sphaerisporangium aureirubrum]|uniref:Rhodanese-like domain-containing protein n=1 Tax=Sphaerisporangium aureirubrum TaxID=1544736 RepID=A0ABW1NUH2_9ACTN
MGIDEYLETARKGLRRLTPREAWAAVSSGAYLVDTRPESQRRRDGEVPGAVVVERNQLEWRLDPLCEARIPEATSPAVRWIVLCDQGYSSSLAAAVLRRIGLAHATDVIGGFQAWRAAGMPSLRLRVPAPPRGPGQGADHL